jgi:hypothetical protein
MDNRRFFGIFLIGSHDFQQLENPD